MYSSALLPNRKELWQHTSDNLMEYVITHHTGVSWSIMDMRRAFIGIRTCSTICADTIPPLLMKNWPGVLE